MTPTAEMTVYAVRDGQSERLRLAVGMPYVTDDGAWACAVELEGAYARVSDVVGANSWHALALAIALLHSLLGHYVDSGGRLFWEEGGEEMRLSDLFPQFRPAS